MAINRKQFNDPRPSNDIVGQPGESPLIIVSEFPPCPSRPLSHRKRGELSVDETDRRDTCADNCLSKRVSQVTESLFFIS